jgi:hypothetical protein
MDLAPSQKLIVKHGRLRTVLEMINLEKLLFGSP